MLHLLKLILAAVVGVWGVLRAAEAGISAWVQRETRPRDLSGLSWA